MDLIIRGGKAVLPEKIISTDIAIKNGKVAAIGNKLRLLAKHEIDARGKLIIPGVVDAHVHFQLQAGDSMTCEDFTNGTNSAACGGVTTVIDFAIQEKGKTIADAIESRRKIADPQVAIDYSLHAVPTNWSPKTKAEIGKLAKSGISSFKMYMVYEGLRSCDTAIFECLEETARIGAMVTIHAESADVLAMMIERYHNEADMKKYGAYCHALSRPDFIEAEAISRAIMWAKATGGKLYIVHLSSGAGLEIIKRARAEGVKVYVETCPHYLIFDDSIYKGHDGYLYATCPQVKKNKDRDALWDGIKRGHIQVIATDNCAFNKAQKERWGGDFTKIPFGIPGVETLLPLIYTHGVKHKRITLRKMVGLLCENPARLMGLYPKKGVIKIGSDADLVLIDPDKRAVITHNKLQSNCDWSSYEGMKVYGFPEMTICRGQIVAQGRKFTGIAGYGRFIKRSKSGLN